MTSETKTDAAEELIRDMLSDGNEVPAEEIFRTAESKGISRRTVNEAKKKISDIVTKKSGRSWVWSIPV